MFWAFNSFVFALWHWRSFYQCDWRVACHFLFVKFIFRKLAAIRDPAAAFLISAKLPGMRPTRRRLNNFYLKKLDPEDAGLLAKALQCVEVGIPVGVGSNSSDVALVPRERTAGGGVPVPALSSAYVDVQA